MKLLPYKVESFGISDIGLKRDNNEDVFRIVEEKRFYALADGMGGHKAGEVAAQTAVDSICDAVFALPQNATPEQTAQFLRESVAAANSRVFALSRNDPRYKGMGTTLSCFVLLENVLVYAHVGDSRLYRFRQKFELLTQDHSLRHVVLAKGGLQESALPSLLFRNVITRAIGTHSTVMPDIGIIPLQAGDLYVLCSDGLTDYVPEEHVIKTISSPSMTLHEIGKELVNMALQKGGNDNITVLLVKIIP